MLSDQSVEDQWSVICDSLCAAGRQHLGFARRNQPDWFTEIPAIIQPLLEERRRCYNRWVASKSREDHACFKAARSKARAEIRRIKSSWLESVAAQADLGRASCHGGSAWTAIRTIQKSFQGLRPIPSTTIRSENGSLCLTEESQRERWQRHFEKVLNLKSQFDLSAFDQIHERPTT